MTNPVVAQAKSNGNAYVTRTSLDGVTYQLHPVSPALMDAVTNRIKFPDVPLWHNPEMDRDEPNPSHPDYLRAVEEANRQRGTAIYDCMVMFGINLPDGLPADDSWVGKLKYMEKHNLLDLAGYDLDDPMDREFVFKRFILATGEMVNEIGNLSALTGQEVKAAEASFPGDAER